MRLDFLAVGLITNMFFTCISINGAQLERTPSRTFVHERKKTLENIPNQPNKWISIIFQIPKEEESKKINILRLLEWDAYYNSRADLKIYELALSGLKQKKFDFGNVSRGEQAIPILSSHFNVASIENQELKNKISFILTDVRNAKVKNFDHKIEYYKKEIQQKLNDLQGKPYLAPTINPLIDGLITQQLEKIQEKATFTRDKDILKNDLEILSPYKKHIRGKNVILFEELEKMVEQTAEIGLPITELALEEESSSSTSSEELPERKTLEPELQIIPYQKSPFEELFKIAKLQTQEPVIIPEAQIPSSSSSSSTSPVNTPPPSPRPRKEKIFTDYLQESTPESNQRPKAPSQAMKDESSEEIQTLVMPNESSNETNRSIVDGIKQQESVVEEIPQPKIEPPLIPIENLFTKEIPTSIPSEKTQTQPISFLWNSWMWITKKLSDFLDKFFWNIYGYR